jgi:hypothetical protein
MKTKKHIQLIFISLFILSLSSFLTLEETNVFEKKCPEGNYTETLTLKSDSVFYVIKEDSLNMKYLGTYKQRGKLITLKVYSQTDKKREYPTEFNFEKNKNKISPLFKVLENNTVPEEKQKSYLKCLNSSLIMVK